MAEFDLETIERTTITTYDALATLIYENGGTTLETFDELERFLGLLNGPRILDIGCGTGVHAPLFTANGYEYIGIDASSEMLALARENHPDCCFRQMSFRRLHFPDAFFDAFLAIFVLQHEAKRNIVNVLREIRRIMKQTGIGLILVPPGAKEAMNPAPYVASMATYVAYWEKEEFAGKLKEAGMEVLSFFSYTYALIFLVSMS